jgi:serine/threonine protein phosphatase PrpC
VRVRFAAATDIGRARGRNEDSYLAHEPLFAVADGMGGHRGGDVASSLAVAALRRAAESGDASWSLLIEEFQEANREIFQRGNDQAELHGMGTTLTAVCLTDAEARIAHVGDSRAYLLRDGSLHLLTEDHTLVERMVQAGKLSRTEARQHPQRSILTRALGVEEDLPVDEVTLPLRAGDRLLLCTDGLTSMIDEDAIRDLLLGEPNSQGACEGLIDAANKAGGDDNITVVLLDVEEVAQARTGQADTTTLTGISLEDRANVFAKPQVKSEADERPARRAPIRWRRAVAWGGAVLVVLLAGFFGVRAYASHQWYVGDADGQVAIYNGIPSEIVGFKLSRVEEITDLQTVQAERLQPWKGIESGITASSFQDAQAIVDQIRLDIGALGSS